ncbi:hypothetical protein [Actinokineospora sp. NBRC 105648]|uniref:hypothetical protein n=1 Tax=Actinokineospora sp. NBRC 105648 TaxID=3032206 RepID=UPI0024A08AC3|nr:hypothetical protein [Actinokineospora sp. NBRC 105648]GLZ40197.1 hypothetical protein Acsp05_38210 [Actinokineospora sp. NBRC 105648]
MLAADNTANLCGRCHRERRDQLLTPTRFGSDFFETDEFRAAFESEHIGRVFKAYRHHPHHLRIFGKALSQELLGRWLNLVQAQVSKLENGKAEQNLDLLRNYAQVLHLPQNLLWFDLPGQSRIDSRERTFSLRQVEAKPIRRVEEDAEPLVLTAARLRSDLTSTLAVGYMGDASIDEWESHVLRLGQATRYRPPAVLLGDLMASIKEMRVLLLHSGTAERRRRLTRVIAQVAGLMSLTLLKLKDMAGSRDWVKTSELLAAETNDTQLQSWTYAQEAYFHFYDANLQGTIEAAQRAQNANSTGVGGILAAAVEARANGMLGRKVETIGATNRAEFMLESLDSGLMIASAFGYNEAQLRFHQGNALTHLGATMPALTAQDRALELYSDDDYLDRALIQLDRAECLIRDGEISSAAELAVEIVTALEDTRTLGIIANRARDVLKNVPVDALSHPGIVDLTEAIESTDQ